MQLRHNKKRNIGLLQEFFSRYIAMAILEKRDADIEKAKSLLSRFFTPKSELGKEIVLFNALMETKVENREIAVSLLNKVKATAKKQNQKKLDEEKSRLIDEIKNTLKDPNFFDRQISDYKTFATIQVLLNANRGIGFKGSLKEMYELEDGVLKNMLLSESSSKQVKNEALEMTDEDIDGLVLKLMTEKVNAKFSGILNEAQQSLVKLYAFSSDANRPELVKRLMEIRTEASAIISKASQNSAFDKRIKDKLAEAKTRLEKEFSTFDKVDDSTITFYMSLLKLKEELNTP